MRFIEAPLDDQVQVRVAWSTLPIGYNVYFYIIYNRLSGITVTHPHNHNLHDPSVLQDEWELYSVSLCSARSR